VDEHDRPGMRGARTARPVVGDERRPVDVRGRVAPAPRSEEDTGSAADAGPRLPRPSRPPRASEPHE
jgi:hypothetical protein